MIGREESATFEQSPIVGLAVLRAQIAPVGGGVTAESGEVFAGEAFECLKEMESSPHRPAVVAALVDRSLRGGKKRSRGWKKGNPLNEGLDERFSRGHTKRDVGTLRFDPPALFFIAH